MTEDNEAFLEAYLSARKGLIDSALNKYMPDENAYPPEIFKAVRYSLFAGGKRLRPILCLAAAEAVGGDIETVLPIACALELIHTYSLIHDDLPAIDNDDYRRGMPTSHKVFGEGIAILAGDALLTAAFHLLSRQDLMAGLDPRMLLAVINDIAEAAGYSGMIGGQVVDMQSEGKVPDYETLHYIHSRKTGVMILVAVKSGARLSGATEEEIDALSEYGRNIGLAFQIADDMLNIDGDPILMGKVTGSDKTRGKMTFPALIGVVDSHNKAYQLLDMALAGIACLDNKADPLRLIASYVLERRS
jgi:geranylgeranyl diphosphate synthase, type II